MNLINNIYFILRFTRCVLNFISNIPYFIYTVITCSINFNYIVIRTLCDSFTNRTFITRFTIVTIKTINSFGKNLCNTSFTRTSRTTKIYAWDCLPFEIALRSVLVTCVCPTTSSKLCGLYIRYKAW